MANCFDVAKYILEKQGQMTTMKLQKLVYYTQAWSLVWDDAPLFEEEIEAWINGPVVPKLFEFHEKKYMIGADEITPGDSNKLTANQKDTINHVLEYYGARTSQWLSDITHLEDPWKKARRGLAPNERGNHVVSLADMLEYYFSIHIKDGD